MKESQFFEAQTISSRIKAQIVSEYFPSYCKIIVRKNLPEQIRYIDLFAGPGKYEDGNHSTPLLIAKECCKETALRRSVRFIFNDMQYHEELRSNFLSEFPDGTFTHRPHFGKGVVGKDQAIRRFLEEPTHVSGKNPKPSLLFIDPFGYKGIETKVLARFLQNWGNEIFLFVNTKRIHPALENDKFESLMLDLFPTTLHKVKQDRKYKSSVSERLNLIIDCLGEEYNSILSSKVYYTAFKFQEEDIDATSHYILHLTKGSRGFDLIKTIYNDFANVGTIFDGVNTYTFDAKALDKGIDGLFDLGSMNIDKLKDQLQQEFKGLTISAYELFESHQVNNLYSRNHYTEALRRLVEENKLSAKFTDNKEHRVSVLISRDCILKFAD